MKKIIILSCFLIPVFTYSQVVSCHKSELKRTKSDRWERVNYKLRMYEFADSNILRKTMQILSMDSIADSIPIKSEKVTFIMTMSFKQSGYDTVICRVAFSELPYMLGTLKGCCLIAGKYVQITGIVPYFLTPTKKLRLFLI